jgi:hypothetical protein
MAENRDLSKTIWPSTLGSRYLEHPCGALPLTEEDRRGRLSHLQLCGWEFRLGRQAVGHGTGRDGGPR